MIEGKTSSGLEFSYDERILEDWSLIEMVKKYDKANQLEKADIIPNLTDLILGKKGFEKMQKHIRSKNDGFCTISQLQAELMEILTSNKELKN